MHQSAVNKQSVADGMVVRLHLRVSDVGVPRTILSRDPFHISQGHLVMKGAPSTIPSGSANQLHFDSEAEHNVRRAIGTRHVINAASWSEKYDESVEKLMRRADCDASTRETSTALVFLHPRLTSSSVEIEWEKLRRNGS